MAKRIRSVNKALIAATLFLSACGAKKEEPVIEVNEETILQKLQDVSVFIESGDWEGAAGLLASSTDDSPAELQKAFTAVSGEEACTMAHQIAPVTEEGRTGGYSMFDCGSHETVVSVRMNDQLQITDIVFEPWPDEPVPEETDDYYEEILYIGKSPRLYGILTIPKETENPSVAVLVPDGIRCGRDDSGDKQNYFREISHMLAKNGIASVRYDQRLYADASLILHPEEKSLDRITGRDFASAVHMLERYPVDASDILLVGDGIGAFLAYTYVYHHFEISGGIILLEPTEDDGMHILAGLEGISGSDTDKAADLLEKDTVDGDAGGMPLAYWKEWKDADPARFIPYVRVPVLMLECGEESEVWKERLGSAAETKCYEDLTEGFRDKDGSLSEDIGEDILKWLRGEDIHEEEKKPEVKKKS